MCIFLPDGLAGSLKKYLRGTQPYLCREPCPLSFCFELSAVLFNFVRSKAPTPAIAARGVA